MLKRNTRLLNPALMAGAIREQDLQMTRLSEGLALAALAAGTASDVDLRTLRVSVALARALATLGYAGDEVALINRACAALRQCSTLAAGSIGLKGDDLAAARALLVLLDAQRSVCGGSAYARALLRTQRELR